MIAVFIPLHHTVGVIPAFVFDGNAAGMTPTVQGLNSTQIVRGLLDNIASNSGGVSVVSDEI